jgi:hypothetical protein
MNQLDHLIQVKRLVNRHCGAETQRPVMGLAIAKGSHADEGSRVLFFPLAMQDFEARQRRHAQIADNQVKGITLFQAFIQITTVRTTGHQVTGAGQGKIQKLAESVVIISEQNMWMSVKRDSFHQRISKKIPKVMLYTSKPCANPKSDKSGKKGLQGEAFCRIGAICPNRRSIRFVHEDFYSERGVCSSNSL